MFGTRRRDAPLEDPLTPFRLPFRDVIPRAVADYRPSEFNVGGVYGATRQIATSRLIKER